MPRTDEVFGVSPKEVLSYIERPEVDERFKDAVGGTTHVVLYGASKQGKTALLNRHVKQEDQVVVRCGPKQKVGDIYRSFLRQLKIMVPKGNRTTLEGSASAGGIAKGKAGVPVVAEGEVEAHADGSVGASRTWTQIPVAYNLDLAQDFGELVLAQGKNDKFFVLENFHYLDQQAQIQIANDLRSFEEMRIRFIVLGIWRNKNRLSQFNGDLLDRVAEVPVEPWSIENFREVALKGEGILNIEIADTIKERIFRAAHGSIGVVQELLKIVCILSDIRQSGDMLFVVDEESKLNEAIRQKVESYGTRHRRAILDIAAGYRTRRSSEKTTPLYVNYYFAHWLLTEDFEVVSRGVDRNDLLRRLSEIHHDPDHLRDSDVGGFLNRLSNLQATKGVMPPILDYETNDRVLKVVDSTFYFFLENVDRGELLTELRVPQELQPPTQ